MSSSVGFFNSNVEEEKKLIIYSYLKQCVTFEGRDVTLWNKQSHQNGIKFEVGTCDFADVMISNDFSYIVIYTNLILTIKDPLIKMHVSNVCKTYKSNNGLYTHAVEIRIGTGQIGLLRSRLRRTENLKPTFILLMLFALACIMLWKTMVSKMADTDGS